jgi:hypothetical protein
VSSDTSIPADLDAFRARFDIRDVASRFAEVTPAGPEQAKILCPVHAEDSPSCYLYAGDNHAHCFGCGWHASLFDLVMAYQGCSFSESVEWLSDAFEIPRPPRSPQAEARARGLREVRAALLETRDDATLPEVFTAEEAAELGIGRADAELPAKVDALVRAPISGNEARAWAAANAYTAELASRSGIAGFGAWPDGLDAPFVRSRFADPAALFAWGAARAAAAELGAFVLVREPLVAIALRRAGVRAAIASGGPLTGEQAESISRSAKRLLIAVGKGSDLAAVDWDLRAALGAGLRVGIVPIGADGTPGAPVPLVAYLARRAADLGADAERWCAEILASVGSPSSRALYDRALAAARR